MAHGELVWWVWDSRRCRCRAAGSHTSNGALLHIHTLPKLSFTGDDFLSSSIPWWDDGLVKHKDSQRTDEDCRLGYVCVDVMRPTQQWMTIGPTVAKALWATAYMIASTWGQCYVERRSVKDFQVLFVLETTAQSPSVSVDPNRVTRENNNNNRPVLLHTLSSHWETSINPQVDVKVPRVWAASFHIILTGLSCSSWQKWFISVWSDVRLPGSLYVCILQL